MPAGRLLVWLGAARHRPSYGVGMPPCACCVALVTPATGVLNEFEMTMEFPQARPVFCLPEGVFLRAWTACRATSQGAPLAQKVA